MATIKSASAALPTDAAAAAAAAGSPQQGSKNAAAKKRKNESSNGEVTEKSTKVQHEPSTSPSSASAADPVPTATATATATATHATTATAHAAPAAHAAPVPPTTPDKVITIEFNDGGVVLAMEFLKQKDSLYSTVRALFHHYLFSKVQESMDSHLWKIGHTGNNKSTKWYESDDGCAQRNGAVLRM